MTTLLNSHHYDIDDQWRLFFLQKEKLDLKNLRKGDFFL
jgi:hypothetical protein